MAPQKLYDVTITEAVRPGDSLVTCLGHHFAKGPQEGDSSMHRMPLAEDVAEGLRQDGYLVVEVRAEASKLTAPAPNSAAAPVKAEPAGGAS